MRLFTSVLILMLVVHVSILAYYLADFGPYGGGPGSNLDPDQVIQEWNGTAYITSWEEDSTSQFGNVLTGINLALTMIRILVVGLPDLMTAWGVASWITIPVYILVCFIYGWHVVYIMTGRETE